MVLFEEKVASSNEFNLWKSWIKVTPPLFLFLVFYADLHCSGSLPLSGTVDVAHQVKRVLDILFLFRSGSFEGIL